MTDYHLLQDGDADDAGNANTLVGHPNLANYVPGDGLQVGPVDYANDVFDLSAGKAFLLLDTESTASDAETRHLCLRTMYFDARSGIDLADGSGLNHVYARLNVGTSDSPKIDVWSDTKESNATSDSLKIAVIDAANEVVDTDFNRSPDGLFDQLTATDIDATTISVDTLIWDDGSQQTSPGISPGDPLDAENYYYDNNPSDGSAPQGTVRRAAIADKANSLDSSIRFPGGRIDGPIDLENTRYETSDESGQAVDVAQRVSQALDNENLLYDDNPSDGSTPSGKVRSARRSDKTDRVVSSGTVPGGTISSAISVANQRYETGGTGGTKVDRAQIADSTTSLNGRDAQELLYEQATKSPQTILPRGKLTSGEPSGTMVELDGATFKLWTWRFSTPNNESPGDLRFRIRAGDGTVLTTKTSDTGTGNYSSKNPVFTVGSRARIHLELYHTNGTDTTASGVAGYTIE